MPVARISSIIRRRVKLTQAPGRTVRTHALLALRRARPAVFARARRAPGPRQRPRALGRRHAERPIP